MTKHRWLTICILILGSGCGGGSLGIGSPQAALSATSLEFNAETVGTTSAAQAITLSNSGAATLNIVSIAASVDFMETDTCGSTLVSGADCIISITFSPGSAGGLTGTLSVTDNAAGSPQNVALFGTVSGGTGSNGTLDGFCLQSSYPGPGCRATSDPTDCPPGQPAKNPGITTCGQSGPITLDGTRCLDHGRASGGYCEVAQ